ncbi:hypothetical protein NTE_01497 [Candidatus Nitrososphaera evergladensis SR1]|uniref:Uncharacterized protein n=2 Tax=Nitrososphaera TaxID=497726 RepID=A0A075MR35_9ARCH|nr:hypothetical protein NTE_01497 [Candidatus Nitrososphaera evergladensis SR1]
MAAHKVSICFIQHEPSRLIRCNAILYDMVARKASRNSSAKEQLKKVSPRTRSAAQIIKDQLRSVTTAIEDRVAIDDHVNNISHEMEYLLDSIDSIPKVSQKKILIAYKNFLKENLDAVESRLGKAGR